MGEITKRETGYAALHVAGIAKASRSSVRASFNRAARALVGHEHGDGLAVPWHTRPPDTLKSMRDRLAEDHKPSTANASLAAVRGALRAAWIAGALDRDTLERARAALTKIKGNSAPGRALTAAQVARLFGAAARAPHEATRARDAAILALLYGCGLRRAEAVALTLASLDPETWRLEVTGKGRKGRVTRLANGARDALAAWLDVRGTEPGPLLRRVTKGGTVTEHGITGSALAARVRRLAKAARIPGDVGPHVLRRSFATQLLAGENDVIAVRDLMGHESTETTATYDRRGESAALRALDTLAIPYTREG